MSGDVICADGAVTQTEAEGVEAETSGSPEETIRPDTQPVELTEDEQWVCDHATD